jgi:hypothetical protein
MKTQYEMKESLDLIKETLKPGVLIQHVNIGYSSQNEGRQLMAIEIEWHVPDERLRSGKREEACAQSRWHLEDVRNRQRRHDGRRGSAMIQDNELMTHITVVMGKTCPDTPDYTTVLGIFTTEQLAADTKWDVLDAMDTEIIEAQL